MEEIKITKNELLFLVNTALQFGVDNDDIIKHKRSERERVAKWMVENTIKDLENKKQ